MDVDTRRWIKSTLSNAAPERVDTLASSASDGRRAFKLSVFAGLVFCRAVKHRISQLSKML